MVDIDPRNSCHLYIMRYRKEAFNGTPKARFIDALQKEGIPCSGGYSLPVYAQPVMKTKAFGPAGRAVPDFPVDYQTVCLTATEKACYEEAVWIPQAVLLGTEDDMMDIVEAVQKIRKHSDEL